MSGDIDGHAAGSGVFDFFHALVIPTSFTYDYYLAILDCSLP